MQWLSVLDGNANSVDLVGKGSLPIEEPLRPSSNEYIDIASLLKGFMSFYFSFVKKHSWHRLYNLHVNVNATLLSINGVRYYNYNIKSAEDGYYSFNFAFYDGIKNNHNTLIACLDS